MLPNVWSETEKSSLDDSCRYIKKIKLPISLHKCASNSELPSNLVPWQDIYLDRPCHKNTLDSVCNQKNANSASFSFWLQYCSFIRWLVRITCARLKWTRSLNLFRTFFSTTFSLSVSLTLSRFQNNHTYWKIKYIHWLNDYVYKI